MSDKQQREPLVARIRSNLGETPEDENTHVLSDNALHGWLDEFNDDTNLVTWRALLVIASSETLRSKKITTQHLSTDGPAVSAELRALAETYKHASQVANDDAHFSGYTAPPLPARSEGEEWNIVW